MPTLEKKTKTQLEVEAKTLEVQVNEQAKKLEEQSEQISQMQQTIKDLQSKLELGDKEREVQKNLLNDKAREAALNPQNLHRKIKLSGHPPDIQAQILKNAN